MALKLWVVENRPSPLLWPLAYTTAYTTVQAVIQVLSKNKSIRGLLLWTQQNTMTCWDVAPTDQLIVCAIRLLAMFVVRICDYHTGPLDLADSPVDGDTAMVKFTSLSTLFQCWGWCIISPVVANWRFVTNFNPRRRAVCYTKITPILQYNYSTVRYILRCVKCEE